jgi:hypothetical protein
MKHPMASRKFWLCVALEFVFVYIILCKLATAQYEFANEYAAMQWVAIMYLGGNVGEKAVAKIGGVKE